jgi:SET domain-containing protein
MVLTHSETVQIRDIIGKGRGVFARRSIEKGEIIERVPVIVLPAAQVPDEPTRCILSGYVYAWGRGTVALALGYGSLYNHSYEPNARYEASRGQTKIFVALRKIATGEEITVNYNGEPGDRFPVWFEILGSGNTSLPRKSHTCSTDDLMSSRPAAIVDA